MRWNDTVTLVGNPEKYQDAEGAWHAGEPKKRTVFCNERKYGSMFMGNLRSNDVRLLNNNLKVDIGQMPEVQLEIRANEYMREDRCIYHGEEYIVIYVTRAGENSILGISRRIGNV